ncbi:methyltransferase family [Grosmannia clavigera kw1407]|uniref:carnosine N-methyltransferase n=1 Tax=Grosmannia clavigera (strain kw1407 / UAMH 11150) TaxID=655863 RepID=F0XLZ6_GROCL|nr:methyltransferase family [Grosmannia clavigera kw1407]EFX01528.1 methyltransferase family [Grosmannia clavigera kw1407]
MATTTAAGPDSSWEVDDAAIQDPEEVKVLFCALDSFLQYAKVSHFHCTHLRRQSFYALSQEHWQMLAAPPFSYLETLDRVDDAIESNADLARAIVRFGLESFCGGQPPGPTESKEAQEARAVSEREPSLPAPWAGIAKHTDVDKARSTLRQFYRDWSAEGAAEREHSYGPVMQALAAERTERTKRTKSLATAEGGAEGGAPLESLKVLVPGAGLGRLVFDLCCAGYAAEGNEISYHQLLASSYVLNFAQRAGQHAVYPWVHSFSNHGTRARQLQACRVPDVHPAQTLQTLQQTAGSMSMCAADFLCLYGDEEHAATFDAVACVFFLDTAPNLIRYLETMWHCLRPGGLLVNVGPLLWHFENHAPGNHGRDDDGDGEHDAASSSGIADPGSFELTDDEVMALVARIGFQVETRETARETPYIHDDRSMLQTVYRSSFWVARKPW